jgi:LEA14-like dessication related protein
MKKLLPLAFLALLLTACKIQPVVPTGIEDVKFGGIDILRGTLTMDLGLRISNPNNFAVTIYGIDLNVNVAGAPLGQVLMAEKIKIAKDTEQVYRVKVDARMTDVINGIPKILDAISKKQSDVELKGSVKAGVGILKKTFPIELKQEKVATGKQ